MSSVIGNMRGATENARPDNGRPPKTGDLTMQNLTLTDQIAGVENARPDNGGPNICVCICVLCAAIAG